MIKLLTIFSLSVSLFLVGCASQATDPALIERAISNDSRIDAHRERDQRSKPEVILGLLNLQQNQSAIDVFGGGGYYSDLMAGVVGDQQAGSVCGETADGSEKFLNIRYLAKDVR